MTRTPCRAIVARTPQRFHRHPAGSGFPCFPSACRTARRSLEPRDETARPRRTSPLHRHLRRLRRRGAGLAHHSRESLLRGLRHAGDHGLGESWTDNSTITGWFHSPDRHRARRSTAPMARATPGRFYSYGTGTATERAFGSVGSSTPPGEPVLGRPLAQQHRLDHHLARSLLHRRAVAERRSRLAHSTAA